MTPDPLNDPIINYGWRRCEKEACQDGDEWINVGGWWEAFPRPATLPCRGNHGYPLRRRIQPPDGMELIGLDERVDDGDLFLIVGGNPTAWKGGLISNVRAVLALYPTIRAFFRPIKIMSEPKEYYRAIKQTSATREDDGTTVKGESLIGYFEGERTVVFKFLQECGHYDFRLEPIQWRSINPETITQLKEAESAQRDAEAALKAIKV